jgi:hypothetical protein
MHDCSRSDGRDESGASYGSESFPPRDRYGGYLAWHALMLTAGEFLKTRPVIADSWRDDPWSDWLAAHALSRRDCLWLADGTDLVPPEMRRGVVQRRNGEGEKSPPLPADPKLLAFQAGLRDDLALDNVVIVDGYWSSADDVDVSVRSVLTDANDAGTVAIAVAAGEAFFQWLPRVGDEYQWQFDRKGSPVRAWITGQDQADRNIDRHDPYATPTALARPRPTDAVASDLGIASSDPFGRIWRDVSGKLIGRAEAWGAEGGGRESAWSRTGARLSVEAETIRALLARRSAGLVVLVKARKYLKERSGEGAFATTTLVFSVDAAGRVTPVLAIPKAVSQALARLEQEERLEFDARFDVVRRCAAGSTPERLA